MLLKKKLKLTFKDFLYFHNNFLFIIKSVKKLYIYIYKVVSMWKTLEIFDNMFGGQNPLSTVSLKIL